MLKKLFAFVLISISAVQAAKAQTTIQPPDKFHTTPPSLSTMHVTFDDEFSGSTLDHTKWVTHYPYLGYINNEQESYVPDAIVPDPAAGVLRIRSDVRNFNNHPYTSGVISTHNHFSQTYGYFEMRAKMPHTTGFWPAFWLFSEYGTPYVNFLSAELDILEQYTQAPAASSHGWHVHVNGVAEGGELYFISPYDLSAGYHTYGLSWQPNLVVYYVDGQEVNRITGDLVPTQPMYVMANVAIGEGFRAPNSTTTFPNTMDIDYIRVYQFNNAAPEYAPPVKLLPIQLSSYNPTPGQKLIITESVVVGPKDIPNANIGIDITDYNGGKVPGADMGIGYPVLKAGTTVTQSQSFVIPANIPSGVYNIVYRVLSNYQGVAGTTVADEFLINNPQVPGSGALALPALTTKPLPAVLLTGTPAPGTAVGLTPTYTVQPQATGINYSLGATAISSTTAKAGDKLTVTATIIAKNAINSFDVELIVRPDEANAVAHRYLNTLVKVPAMQAGAVQQVSASFKVPEDMPAGKYNYESWGPNGTGGITDQQINKLTIE
jgi:beta-glucanase (GH16 family)